MSDGGSCKVVGRSRVAETPVCGDWDGVGPRGQGRGGRKATPRGLGDHPSTEKNRKSG